MKLKLLFISMTIFGAALFSIYSYFEDVDPNGAFIIWVNNSPIFVLFLFSLPLCFLGTFGCFAVFL